jgi:hypothetical protein
VAVDTVAAAPRFIDKPNQSLGALGAHYRLTRHFEEADMFRIILTLVTLTLPVAARDTGQRENQPIYLRQWFQKLMQPDNPDMSCYGEADAVEADSFEIRGDQYVAIITNGKDIIPEGTRISVPKN